MAKYTVYTHGHHTSVLRAHTWRTAENSAAHLLPHLKPNMTLLDIGCGPGTITTDFAALLHEGSVTGLDIPGSEPILDQARALASSRRLTNITFVTGDARALPFPDDTFDVVHAHQVLQHVGDPVQMLKEMRRVAKPGGLVSARESDFAGMAWYPDVPGLEEWRQGYRRVARANGGEPDSGRRLHVWAKEAGFECEDLTLSAGTWCYCTEDDRTWWGESWAERCLSSNFASTALEHGIFDEEGLKRISGAWTRWFKDEDGWFTVIHGELIARV
ncbi:methyltransferase type 11 [Trametes maxima]|nr:methyltransferase type 11 [Trametes maxima]